MTYAVRVLRGARRDVERLPDAVRRRLYEAARGLADNPRPSGALKLTDRNAWRVGVGDYRILYTIDDTERIVTVARILHRSRAYR